MSNPRAVLSKVLSEYQERADSARFYTRRCGWHDDHVPGRDCTCPPASPRIPLADMIEYSDRMVAALRAVLGNHWCIEGGEECGFDGRFWPCPDYRAITEALGGTDA